MNGQESEVLETLLDQAFKIGSNVRVEFMGEARSGQVGILAGVRPGYGIVLQCRDSHFDDIYILYPWHAIRAVSTWNGEL